VFAGTRRRGEETLVFLGFLIDFFSLILFAILILFCIVF